MRRFIRKYLVAAVVAVAFVAGTPACASDLVPVGVWKWSPDADWHKAVVRIDGGSGVYVTLGKVKGVLTAKHVLSDLPTTITWPDGTTTKVTHENATQDKYGHDIGFVIAEKKNLRPLPVASIPPGPDDILEFAGWGGMQGRLRHWYGKVGTDNLVGMVAYNCAILQGDSGGPVLNSKGEVVGVMTAGQGEIGRVENAKAFRKAYGPRPSAVIEFCQRVERRWGLGVGVGGWRSIDRPCPDGQCPTPRSPPVQRDDWAYPPISPRQKPPEQPAVDYSKLLDMMAKDDRFQPKQGPKGDPGPPGKTPIIDYHKLLDMMASDPRFQPRQGPQGPPGRDAAIDMDLITRSILGRLPPVYVQMLDKDGNVTQEQRKPLGEPIRFQFVPVN